MARRTKTDLLGSAPETIQPKRCRIFDHNTLRYTLTDGTECFQLHDTVIVRKYPTGKIGLNTSGWLTVTTKDRINKILDLLGSKWGIYQERSLWFLSNRNGSNPIPYYDGQIINEDDVPTNQGANEHARKRVLQKQLTKYIRKLRAVCKATGTPKPEIGDCFYCSHVDVKTGKPVPGTDHLISHLDECYVMGSLIFNALRARGRPQPGIVWNMTDIVCRDVRGYFKKELGI